RRRRIFTRKDMMMCCGSKRSAWRAAPAPPHAGPPPRAPEAARAEPNFGPVKPGVTLIKLRYWDSASIRLRGPITGRAYSFSDVEPVQEVDVRDATIFVQNTRLGLSAVASTPIE